MEPDLQKANMWKRISAALFDIIAAGILIVGVGFLLSLALRYGERAEALTAAYNRYENEYGVEFRITGAQYESMAPEEKERFNEAYSALIADNEAVMAYGMVINLTLLIISLSIFAGYFILEFIVPLLFKNGQTLGKRIFGLGVMHTSGIRVTPVLMFFRSILGKYTLETMIPVLIGLMIFFGATGWIGTAVLGAFLLLQVVLLAATRTNSPLHDILAKTVVVDMSSQRIFNNGAELLEYRQKLHAEEAAAQPY